MSPVSEISFGSAKNFYCCRYSDLFIFVGPLEVLRISTVVDSSLAVAGLYPFGSAKNFYCCRSIGYRWLQMTFGSAKNFYCCRSCSAITEYKPLEVLRISTVVDLPPTT